ncbi:MAG: hypothetical protein Q4G28_01875 [Neisseria sp.]|nr:hypothetical protein [Neisseria sp.]
MNRTLKIRPWQPVASLEEVSAVVKKLNIRPECGRVAVIQQGDGRWYIAGIVTDTLDAETPKQRFKRVSGV